MMTTNQLHELLKYTLPFSGFTITEQESIASELTITTFNPNDVILSQGHTEHIFLYIVVSGQVRIIEKSTRKIARIISSYTIFGHYGLLQGNALPYQVEAVDQVEVALLPADAFYQLYQQHRRFAAFFDGDLRVYERSTLSLHDVSGSQFLFGTRLRELIQNQAAQCSMELSVQQAASAMDKHNTDYIVVTQNDKPIGIFTDRLLRSEIVSRGRSLQTPLHAVMNKQLHFMTQRNSLFEALILMLKKGVSHVLVNDDKNEKLQGVIGNSDIARGQGYNPMLVIDQVAQLQNAEHLKASRDEANLLLVQLYRRGVRAQNLITINTIINDAITGRVLELCKDALVSQLPEVNFDWVWLSLGSEGRGEMSLKADQDNALVYCLPDKVDSEQLQPWLANWSAHVNASLDDIGLSLCDGGMMAGNPLWRINIHDWQDQCNKWLNRSQAMQIMQASAACDLRAVHGHVELEGRLKFELNTALKANPRFLKHMALAVISNRPPVSSLTGRIRILKTEQGKKINIKRSGIQTITEFARILCLQAGFTDSSNTFDRLEYLKQTQPQIKSSVSDALDSYSHLNDIRLGHQLQAISTGREADNMIAVNELSDTQYQMLKAAFSSIKTVQATLAHRFNLM